ncbi:hypothetical protein JCM10212_005217 [Sporobolomyces blumeae]
MPLDLSHPRYILPFASGSDPTPARGPPRPAPSRPASTAPQGPPAIHLRLNEETWTRLTELARDQASGKLGKQPLPIRLDAKDGVPTAFVLDGHAHVLSVNPEPPHSEVHRISPTSRSLEPIATITHRATIKTGAGAENLSKLERASQNLKKKREEAEREKEGRKAILLDSAPSLARSSSLSRGRPSNLASSPPSRTASPISNGVHPPSSSTTTKHASRLTATSASSSSSKAANGSKGPTSSFRIGKGTLPAAISARQDQQSKSNGRNAAASSSSSSAHSNASTPAGSPPPSTVPLASLQNSPRIRTNDSTSTATGSKLQPPTRQFSSSSASSSASSAAAQSTNGTSPEMALQSSLDDRTRDASGSMPSSTKTVKGRETVEGGQQVKRAAGGGGIMKGKQTLKKEARRTGTKASASSATVLEPAVKTKGSPVKAAKGKGKEREQIEVDEAREVDVDQNDEDDDVDAEGEEDDEVSYASASTGRTRDKDRDEDAGQAKKKRKIEPSSPRLGTSSLKGERSRPVSSASTAKPIKTTIRTVEKVVSTASEGEGVRSSKIERRARDKEKDSAKIRDKERDRDKGRDADKAKKRKKQETSRWYSSDSDDVGDPDDARPAPNGSVASTHAPKPSSSIPLAVPPHLVPTITSLSTFREYRAKFYELYAPYAVLHSKLNSLRFSLDSGPGRRADPGSHGLEDIARMVEQVEEKRNELEGIKEGLKKWKASSKAS